MFRRVLLLLLFSLLLTVACDDEKGDSAADGGAGDGGVVLAGDAAVSAGSGGGGSGGESGGTGGTDPEAGTGGGVSGAGSGGEPVMDGGQSDGEIADAGAAPDAADIPSDGSWLSICYGNSECMGDDLVCFADGGGYTGFCTEDCVEDIHCRPIDGMDAVCSQQGECYVPCDGADDTDCPDNMECRQTGGVEAFGCAYPEGTGTGASGQWESCEVSRGDADCEQGLVCYLPTWPPANGGTGFCTTTCANVTECEQPADVTITSTIACGPTAAGDRWCRLDCTLEGSTCPDGMACEDVVPNPQQQVLVCRYPQM